MKDKGVRLEKSTHTHAVRGQQPAKLLGISLVSQDKEEFLMAKFLNDDALPVQMVSIP